MLPRTDFIKSFFGSISLQKRENVMKSFYAMFLMLFMVQGKALAADPLLFMPFNKGERWHCTQGPAGRFSHYQQPLLHAYDLDQGPGSNSSNNAAFGKSVYSPVAGTVAVVDNSIPDFTNNSSGNANNNYGWGNQVVIRDKASGKYVRMNHLQQYSVAVKEGQSVSVGQFLARVGQSGYSTSPHLHLQAQNSAEHGNSIPFKFVEGPMVCPSGWLTSLNLGNTSVLDNDGAVNLGNAFSWTEAALVGDWFTSTSVNGFVGAHYIFHEVGYYNDAAKVTWSFAVRESGIYNIIASWTPNPNRDTRVKYTVLGQTVMFNQQSVDWIGKDNWTTLLYGAFLSTGRLYTVSAQGTTSGKVIVADSIILQRL